MASVFTAASGGFALSAAEQDRLRRRVTEAIRRARRAGEALAAITVPAASDVDPSAVVHAARRAGDPWFCFEQPDRDRAAVAALGVAVAIEADGADRFRAVAKRWRTLASRAACDPPDGPRGCGPIAVGGFAFAPDGGQSPPWAGFAAASLHVPEVALVRRGEDVRLTFCVLAHPDDTVEGLVARLAARAAALRDAPALPLLDPSPAGRYRVVSAMP